jgi:hypothetical protein
MNEVATAHKIDINVQNLRLQNFPLDVNEMEALQFDTSTFAQIMAHTLAILQLGKLASMAMTLSSSLKAHPR